MKKKIADRFNSLTISRKITAIYAGVFSAMLIIISLIFLWNMWYYYRSVSKSEITALADKIEAYIEEGNDVNMHSINDLNDNPYIEVMVRQKNRPDMFFGTMKRPDDFSDIDKGLKNREGGFYRNDIGAEPYIYTQRDVSCNGADYEIVILRRYNHEQKIINIFMLIFMISDILSIAVAVIIGRYISGKILNPIKQITDTAESISLYDLSQRIEVPDTDDEIKTLVLTFNDMIERLQISFEKENQFISDASHELKTPIAIIQGYINMVDRWGKEDKEILDEAIDSIKSETQHMSLLIQQLLYLARDTRDENIINKEVISLTEIADEVKKEAEVAVDNINISLEADENVYIYADSSLIKQLMWIFIDNSVKYSAGKRCEIKISVGTEEDRAYFAIEDKGIGIPQKALDKIFDRFYRNDRSRNKEIRGNGLGLSIAKTIADRHNGEITVKSVEGKGSEFKVSFSGSVNKKCIKDGNNG